MLLRTVRENTERRFRPMFTALNTYSRSDVEFSYYPQRTSNDKTHLQFPLNDGIVSTDDRQRDASLKVNPQHETTHTTKTYATHHHPI
jgi:hypothetical protein